MGPDVSSFVRKCEVCAKNKDRTQAPPGFLHPLEVPVTCFETWTIDFVTDLPWSKGCNAFLTCVENLTKYVVVVPCKMGDGTLTASATADLFFDAIVLRFGVPRSIVSDRDLRFTAQLWQQLWARLGTKLRMASAYHPQTDGQTERAHRTIEQALRCLLSENRAPASDWVTWMPCVTLAINSMPGDATGKSPNELAFGQ